eukprot:gene16948-biopygen9883
MCPHSHSEPQKPEDIVREEGAQLDFSRDMSYGDYLQLDSILTAQKPLSPALVGRGRERFLRGGDAVELQVVAVAHVA